MKSQTDYLTIHVPSRMGFVNITSQVQECVVKSGVREGMCLVNSMHITSSVFVSVDEPGLHEDFQRWLEHLAPTTARRSATSTTSPANSTPMPTSSGRSSAGRWCWRSRWASSISARLSIFFMRNSTATGPSACW